MRCLCGGGIGNILAILISSTWEREVCKAAAMIGG